MVPGGRGRYGRDGALHGAEGGDDRAVAGAHGQRTARAAQWLFRELTLSLVQMDELYAKVKDSEQACWLWLVIDPVTKVIPTLHLGGRKSIDAYAVAHDLKERLEPDCVPSVMTDGLWMYFYALTAHFGHWFRPKRARTDHWQPDERLASRAIGETNPATPPDVYGAADGVGQTRGAVRGAGGPWLPAGDPNRVY